MRPALTIGIVAAAQLALVGVGVAPQLSARMAGDSYVLRVAPLDPLDPFRGAYVSLDYPQLDPDRPADGGEQFPGERGDVFIPLVPQGEVWVGGEWTRERPQAQPYLACSDRSWQVDCGIDSWFLPQDEAAAMERTLADGAFAEIRVDARGNAALVDVRSAP